jgi:hypothetical protein
MLAERKSTNIILRRLKPDSTAWKHLRNSVGAGLSTIAKRVSETVDYERGSLFAFAPESLDVDSVENFEWDVPGAHYAIGRRHLKDVVKRFLATTGGTVHSGLLVLAKKHFGSRRPTSLADPWRRTVLGIE